MTVAVVTAAVLALTLVASLAWSGSPGGTRQHLGGTAPATSAPDAPERSTTTSTTPSAPSPLSGAVAAYLPTREGTITIGIEDLVTGQTWLSGAGSAAQATASVVKVDILATLLHQSEGSGQPLSAGQQSLATSMIEESDNDSATALWEDAGGAAGLAAFNSLIGMSGTTPSACVECPDFPWPGWGLTTTTAQDQLTLLRTIVEPSPYLDTEDQGYIQGLMENVTPSEQWGVDGGVPAGVTVALKNGWLPLNDADTDWQINSIGWINGMGRDYLLTVLTTGNPTEQYGIDTIDQISTLVWSALPAPG